MRSLTPIPAEEVIPSVQSVLEAQGIPRSRHNNERTTAMAREAIDIYRTLTKPRAVIKEIPARDFAIVFHGEGKNNDESPVGPISEASTTLAIFAVTIGEPVCKEISTRFKTNDFALAAMLDAAASEGTEMAAQVVENRHRKILKESGRLSHEDGILRFSPGYCGWHISAQKRLFEVLHPGEVGITLNQSYLMHPLKSITGVIISGNKSIFCFDDTFSFCSECSTHNCRERITAVLLQDN